MRNIPVWREVGGLLMPIEVNRLRSNRGGFERLPNEAGRNTELSIAAVGLLVRLLIDGGSFASIDAIADFYSAGSDGSRKRGTDRDAYRSAAKELEAARHLVRTRIVVNGLPGWRLQVFAEPYTPDVRPAPKTAEPSLGTTSANEQNATSDVTNAGKLPMTAKPLSPSPAETNQNPSSSPATAEPLSVSPAETVQTPSSRPTTAKPSSFLTDVSTDKIQTTTAPPSEPPDWFAAASEGAGVQGEGEGWETASAAEAASPVVDSVADDSLIHQAVLFVDKLPFDQRPTSSERGQLVRLAGLWLAAGWTHDALMAKCESNLGDVRDRINVWINHRLPEHRVTKAPRTSAGPHETYCDPNPAGFRAPKGQHVGWQNPTDPDAYEGTF